MPLTCSFQKTVKTQEAVIHRLEEVLEAQMASNGGGGAVGLARKLQGRHPRARHLRDNTIGADGASGAMAPSRPGSGARPSHGGSMGPPSARSQGNGTSRRDATGGNTDRPSTNNSASGAAGDDGDDGDDGDAGDDGDDVDNGGDSDGGKGETDGPGGDDDVDSAKAPEADPDTTVGSGERKDGDELDIDPMFGGGDKMECTKKAWGKAIAQLKAKHTRLTVRGELDATNGTD